MARITVLPEAEAIGTVDALQLIGGRPPPRRDPQTGQPDELRTFVVCEDPRIVVVPHFLSEAECGHVLELAEGLFSRSMVGSFAAGDPTKGASGAGAESSAPSGATGGIHSRQSQTRTSTSCMLRARQTAAVDRIEQRLACLAKLPLETLERPTVVRYAPGEHFNEHHDGKFRPRTVFVYLNDLPEDDPGGDTFFPHLGLSFRPRTGCAVMWTNPTPDGVEDSRLVHCGRPPKSGVKFGINCFFNDERMRLVNSPQADVRLQDAYAVDVRALLVEGHGDERGGRKCKLYKLNSTPGITAVPSIASDDEVDHLLELARLPLGEAAEAAEGDDALLRGGTRLLRLLGVAESPVVEALEGRLAEAAQFPLDNVGPLRLVRAGIAQGLCNRGCGQKSGLVCLSDRDEVFFPHLGLRLVLRRGDALLWPNAWFSEPVSAEPSARTRVVEDLRSTRLHLGPSGDGTAAALSLDVSFHDSAIRSLQGGAAAGGPAGSLALSGG